METDPTEFAPKDKFDVAQAESAVRLGYPAVAPILVDLLTWLQDYNWPVAHVLAPFLASIGAPLAPYVRAILETNDTIWKYWVLSTVVADSPALAASLRPEITALASGPARDEDEADVRECAAGLVKWMHAG